MIPVPKDHVEQGKDRLLQQFYEKDNITAILTSFLKQIQITEDCLFDLLDFSSLSTAVGASLDVIGGLVGAKRLGRTDSAYRDHIQLTLLLNSNEGTPNNLLEILSLLTDAEIVKLWEHYPVSCIYYTNGQEIPSGLASSMTNASPITSGDVVIIHDPNNDGFTPAELTTSLASLVDVAGNPIVDGEGNNIVAGKLGAELSENSWRAVLPEIDGSVPLFGILPEIFT